MVRLKTYARERFKLISNLEQHGIIRSKQVKEAMLSVPRELFVWEDYRDQSYIDAPLLLGRTGQTISAPHMVAMMLEELDLRSGLRVLEVGCGSGYNAACIAQITGRTGKVVSLEIRRDLVEFAQESLASCKLSELVEVHSADGTLGWPTGSQDELYDRVVITAAAREIPPVLIRQLIKGGILLAPLGGAPVQQLTRLKKSEMGELTSRIVCDCIFVPLVEGETAPA